MSELWIMIKYLKYFRNKYVLTTTLFLVYILFLDDVDIFSIVRQKQKNNILTAERDELEVKLNSTKAILFDLDDSQSLEKYARENKLYKKDDEDIFVIE